MKPSAYTSVFLKRTRWTHLDGRLPVMPYPRHLLVSPDTTGTYHCVSRCVRRAFLCGNDPVSGRCFDHRKALLEERILRLGKIFAVSIHAYAVMSNHFHLVLDLDPSAPESWADELVASRWLSLLSTRDDHGSTSPEKLQNLLREPERLKELRHRLGSLSWFMRFLKEPIARLANKEDGCTGRFWEGRFKTQALLDDAAVLACMAYVDLNPVRAGIARNPAKCAHTSFSRRFGQGCGTEEGLEPLASTIHSRVSPMRCRDYRDLVHWTSCCTRAEAESGIPDGVSLLLRAAGTNPARWLVQVPATESRYWRAIGSVQALTARAQRLGHCWLKGIGMARGLERIGWPAACG